MQELVEKLITVLEKTIKTYKKLLDKTKAKNTALVNRKLENVEKITAAEAALVEQVKESENARIDILEEISKEAGIPFKELSITKISTLIPEDLKDKVFKSRDNLKIVLDELRRYNEVNTQIIKQSLELIELTFKTVSSAANKKVTYEKTKGRDKKKTQRSVLIDRKV